MSGGDAGSGFRCVGEEFDECGLAAAIETDDADAVAGVDCEVDVLKYD